MSPFDWPQADIFAVAVPETSWPDDDGTDYGLYSALSDLEIEIQRCRVQMVGSTAGVHPDSDRCGYWDEAWSTD